MKQNRSLLLEASLISKDSRLAEMILDLGNSISATPIFLHFIFCSNICHWYIHINPIMSLYYVSGRCFLLHFAAGFRAVFQG